MREGNAGEWKREAALEFDGGIAGARTSFTQKRAHGAAGQGRFGGGPGFHVVSLDGQIPLAECGEGIVPGLVKREFVNASVSKMQLQLALCAVGNYNRFLGQSQAGDVLGVGTREKDPFPAGGG